MKYKIGVIGPRETVLGFLTLGFVTEEAESAAEAGRKLHAMVHSGEYAVILITEAYAMSLSEETRKYLDLPLPAVVTIPAASGSLGYGKQNLHALAERASGADLLLRD